jgi:hypothetical protein
MLEATCSSEMYVDFQRTTLRYTSEVRTLHYFVLSAQVYSTVMYVQSYWVFIELYATLVAITCTQLQKLQTKLKNFRKESLTNTDTEQEELHECVRFHQNILR